MLRHYVNEHHDDWDLYATALTYAYNIHVHRSTGTTPFSLVLSRPPPEFSLHHALRSRTRPTQEQRKDYVRRLNDKIEHLYTRLLATQFRYKRDFDKLERKINNNGYEPEITFKSTRQTDSRKRVQTPALGPFHVIRKDERTYEIDRNGATERINADRVTYEPPPENAPTKDENDTKP